MACSKGYQPVVDMIEGFLKERDGLTDDNKGHLRNLGEIYEVAASVGNEKGEANEMPAVAGCKKLIKDICSILLFGPYTFIVTQLAETFSIVKEMENKQKEDESFKLPEAMQARVDAVNDYLEKAKGRLRKIDDTLCGLTPKVSLLPSTSHHNHSFLLGTLPVIEN